MFLFITEVHRPSGTCQKLTLLGSNEATMHVVLKTIAHQSLVERLVHESNPPQVATVSIGVAKTHPFPGSTRRHAPLRLLPLLVHRRRDPSCGLPTVDPTASETRDPVQDVGARREQPIDVDCCIRAKLSIDPAFTPTSPPVAAPCDLRSIGRSI
jgi:hypothetical protein